MDLSAYFAGFVDGEGCFTVSFSPRSTLLIGWEVRPSFSVSQNADRSEVLLLMQQYFGCGSIRPDRSDKTLKFRSAASRGSPRAHHSVLRSHTVTVPQAARCRTIRDCLPPSANRRSSQR